MEIRRDGYLRKLRAYAWDGQIKVVTGIRRCGKSYLLNELYRKSLLAEGVPPERILTVSLDLTRDIMYRDPLRLAAFVRERTEGREGRFYLFVDEIQMSDEVPNPYNPGGKRITFYDALNELRLLPNLDVYVTGSDSRMLSADIMTEFRGRSDEIRVHPLSFSEYYSAVGGDKSEAFEDYALFGGMPLTLSRPDDTSRMEYLKSLFTEVYLKDIVERRRIEREDVLAGVTDVLCSSVGSLTNPTRLAGAVNTAQHAAGKNIVSPNTVRSYLGFLEDAFLFHECRRYDLKGKAYFDYPNKYYCEDVGLRNARIGFRQQEMTHIMENIVCNELLRRGYSVDVGVVFRSENGKRVAREIDFAAIRGTERIYVQSAYAMEEEEKRTRELLPFTLAGDSFPKIVVRRDLRRGYTDDLGVRHVGIEEFLLEE